MDASTRRFRAQKIYLRATAALRWINSRNAILREQKPRPEHGPALQQIANTLRAVSQQYSLPLTHTPLAKFCFSLRTTPLIQHTGACFGNRRSRGTITSVSRYIARQVDPRGPYTGNATANDPSRPVTAPSSWPSNPRTLDRGLATAGSEQTVRAHGASSPTDTLPYLGKLRTVPDTANRLMHVFGAILRRTKR